MQGSSDFLRGNFLLLHNPNSYNTSEEGTWPTEQKYKGLLEHRSRTTLGFEVLCLQIMVRILGISAKF